MRKVLWIPTEFMEKEMYKNLSDGAKVLFGLLSEKKAEAEENNWIDPMGVRYVVFPKKQMQEELHCSRYGIDLITKELETLDLIRFGYLYQPVIERRIYVRSFDENGPKIRVEYGDDEPRDAAGKPDERKSAGQEKNKEGDAPSEQEQTGGASGSSVPSLPKDCPMRGAGVKDLVIEALCMMLAMAEAAFEEDHEKQAG